VIFIAGGVLRSLGSNKNTPFPGPHPRSIRSECPGVGALALDLIGVLGGFIYENHGGSSALTPQPELGKVAHAASLKLIESYTCKLQHSIPSSHHGRKEVSRH
jgi:hypothetical protein